MAYGVYQRAEVEEAFNCNYGLNPELQPKLEAAGLQITGTDEKGEARIIELPGRRFFLATAFQPQLSSEEARSHPLIVAFLKAALAFRETLR